MPPFPWNSPFILYTHIVIPLQKGNFETLIVSPPPNAVQGQV